MSYFVTFTAFLFCFWNQGVSAISLTLTTPADHIRGGTSITLTCKIFDLDNEFFNQDGSIVFSRHSNNINRLSYYTPTNSSTTSPRYKVSGEQWQDHYAVRLQITEMVQEDGSEYQCATYRAGTLDTASTFVNLHWIQTAPKKYPICEARTEDDLLYLKCYSAESVPPPDLAWFKNGIELIRKTEVGIFYHTNKLTMNLTDFNGTYECRYYYVGGGINDERSCRIEKPNIIVVSPASIEFMNGSDAKITVLARASPPMSTTMLCEWDHNKVFSVQTDGNDLAMITILDVDFTMNGSHITCCGESYIGKSCESFLFLVRPKENLSNRSESRSNIKDSVAEPLVIIIILIVTVVLLTAVGLALFLSKKGKKKSRPSSDVISLDREMRSPSFASNSTESQNSNADSGVNLHDVPCLLKRSATVPAPRRLPAPPRSSLSQVHEYDGTSRNETYSIIKTELKETNLQPYMDMGGKKRLGKASPTYSDELPSYNNSTVGFHDDADHKGPGKAGLGECSPRVKDSPDKVGYLEVKKDPNSQCQYQDLEDLYRETASNNLYAP